MSRVRILIVECEEGSAARVESDLRAAGFTEIARCSPAAAAGETSRTEPDLVLVEFADSGIADAELCRAVKRTIKSPSQNLVGQAFLPASGQTGMSGPPFGVGSKPVFVPVLALTGEEPTSVVRGFEAGADDCIHWPYDVAEMLARVRSMLHIKNLHDELRRLNVKLTELSTRDGLTGLFNRRYLFEQLAAEVERAVRYQQPLSCIMLDMDEFKPINDRYGHLVGDELFRRAAEVFRSIPRRVDVVARYGGDEVAMLLPATAVEAAVNVAERVCRTTAREKFTVGDCEIAITVSLGVACLDPRNPITSDELVHRADVALYSSKHAGGNRVAVWQADMEPEV